MKKTLNKWIRYGPRLSANPIYKFSLIEKFLKTFVRKGRRYDIDRIFYDIFAHFFHKNFGSVFVVYELIEKFRPTIRFLPIRKRKLMYSVPVPMLFYKQYFSAVRYLFKFVGRGVEYDKNFKHRVFNRLFVEAFFAKRLVVPELKIEKDKELLKESKAFKHYRWAE